MNDSEQGEKSPLAAFWLEVANVRLFLRSDAMRLYLGEILFAVIVLALVLILAACFDH